MSFYFRVRNKDIFQRREQDQVFIMSLKALLKFGKHLT